MRTAGQIHIMRVFDELIANFDRNAGNILWSSDGKMWLIDHARVQTSHTAEESQTARSLRASPAGRAAPPDHEGAKTALGSSLTQGENDTMLARRDVIVRLFDDKVSGRGEGSVLYTLR